MSGLIIVAMLSFVAIGDAISVGQCNVDGLKQSQCTEKYQAKKESYRPMPRQ